MKIIVEGLKAGPGLQAEMVQIGGAHPHQQTVWKRIAPIPRGVEIYLNSLPAENGNGTGTATVKAIYDAVCRLGGEVANVGIVTPVEDVLVGIGQKIVAGTVTIN